MWGTQRGGVSNCMPGCPDAFGLQSLKSLDFACSRLSIRGGIYCVSVITGTGPLVRGYTIAMVIKAGMLAARKIAGRIWRLGRSGDRCNNGTATIGD